MSIMSPRPSEPRPWLMPVMSSPVNGAHGIAGKLALYPWKNIFVREGADINGDGAKENPLNSLAQIFDDDDLECLCQSLCCDCITVFVSGDIIAGREEGKNGLPDEMIAVDGKGRDYAGNLRIAPWGSAKLKIGAERDFMLSGGEDGATSEKITMMGVKNVSGVIFENVEIALRLTGYYQVQEGEEAVEIPKLNIQGKMICADGLIRCAFPDAILSAIATIDIRTGIEYATYRPSKKEHDGSDGSGPGWGGGGIGDGDGGGGGGSSPGWDSNAPDIPKDDEEEEDEEKEDSENASELIWGSGAINVRLIMRGFVGCSSADITDSKANISADIKTSVGAVVDGAGVASSKEISCQSFACLCISNILVEGGGTEFKRYDAEGLIESGVETYSLTGHGNLSGIMSSPESSLSGVLCECKSTVEAIGTNTPHTKNELTGEVQTFPIGGSSKAESYGFRACNRAKISLSDCECYALASHPVLWGHVARPLSGNVGADIADSTFSEPYCLSNHVDFCE